MESTTTSEATVPTSNRILIGRARASLKGRWGLAVLAMLIYLGIFSLFGFVGALFAPYPTYQATQSPTVPTLFVIRIIVQIVLEFLIMGPLLVGFCRFFLGMARRSEIAIADLFKGFRIFWKALGTFVLIYMLSLFWMLLGFLPMIAVIFWTQLHHLRNQPVAIVAIVLLGILGWVGAMLKIIGYWMSYFVLSDQSSTGALSAIRKSKAMMQGRKWKFVCLLLRFLGWYLLALLTCGIGLLWVLPYTYTAIAHFYLDVKERKSLPNV